MFYNNKFKKVFKVVLILSVLQLSISCSGSSDSIEGGKTNTKPIAENDTLIVEENSSNGDSNQIDVSKNDKFGDDGGDKDNYDLEDQADHGIVSEIRDGIFEYIPNKDFFGSDSFTYKINDKDGDEDLATVLITINKFEFSAENFNNIDPNFPSFTSIDDTTPSGKKWVKLEAMSDEFDAWDDKKWFKSTWNYGVPVFMTKSSENSGVTNGKLWIKATLNESNTENRWFQTARIHSVKETKYPMYTEARVKTAHISAYNTFWLNNGDINNRGEIDIIENNSKPSCGCQPNFPNQMNSQYFQADENKTPKTVRDHGNFLRSKLSPTNPLINVGWNEGYHTYGVWWKDSKNIQFYLDGERAGSVVVGEHLDGKTYDRELTRELEIIFDLWTSKDNWVGGLPPKSDLNNNSINTMKIDWVRTWKLKND